MRKSVIGMIAHVDAGKTTLSEAMLYLGGAIRKIGRVDHGDAFLDNFALERERGITIFAKQASLNIGDLSVTLLDTPGHVDFSAETERTLDVIDCAVMLISAPEGVQSHTLTLWKLLRERNIPTFIFVNKCDLSSFSRGEILEAVSKRLDAAVFDYEAPDYEAIASESEKMLEEYLETGEIKKASVKDAFSEAKIFPCCFGAALKLDGVDTLLKAIEKFAPTAPQGEKFGAKVFKISRDERGGRITHMKITGGKLSVRDSVEYDGFSEKVTQLRVYSGGKFTAVESASSGDVVAAAGLEHTYPSLGLGKEKNGAKTTVTPTMAYSVVFPKDVNIHEAVENMRLLEEEDPALGFVWDEGLSELRVRIMGRVQLEILKEIVRERFGYEISFASGRIIYQETIKEKVEGIGHFEPLRHYAEVHLLLEPLKPGSGLVFDSDCPEDALDRNWQRLILTHLGEKQHKGVLTGSPITDMKITLASGRAHVKHTEGGDFREATYRAVRQGLMRAESVLLEPWYGFVIELPKESVGRAISDLEMMHAKLDPPKTYGDSATVSGSAAVSEIGEYQAELTAYTHGLGKISVSFSGYRPCPNQDDVVREIGYDAESDVSNTPDSVFCGGGTSFIVKWREVEKYMHLESALAPKKAEEIASVPKVRPLRGATDDELMAIFESVYGPVKTDRVLAMRPSAKDSDNKKYSAKPQKSGENYVLVDGYNIIFAWEELRKMAQESIELARETLTLVVQNYAAFRSVNLILVFDAYRVKNTAESVTNTGGISVVYTKEAQTADQYIERTAHNLAKDNNVRVATSDSLEQIIILGRGARVVSASAFEAEVKEVMREIHERLGKVRPSAAQLKDFNVNKKASD